MIRFGEMQLTDIVYYPTARFDFGQRGVSYVTGINHNGEVDDYRNGTGKSMLVQALSHLRFRDSRGNNKKANYDALFTSTSEITWRYSVEGVNYQVTERGTGKRYTVLRDQIDQEPRTPTIAQSLIDTSIDLAEEEFYTYVYLDSRRPSVFQTGTAANRHAYFTNLFRLNEIDVIGAQLRKHQAALALVQRDLDLREADLAALGVVADIDTIESQLNAVRRRLRKTEREIKRDGDLLEDRRLAEQFAADYRLAEGYNAQEWKDAQRLHREWEAYDAAARAQQGSERLASRNEAALERGNRGLETAHPYTSAGVDLFNAGLRERRQQDQAAARRWDRADREYREAQGVIRRLGAARQEAEDLTQGLQKTRRVEVVERDIERLEDERGHLNTHRAGGVCDSCGSRLDPSRAKSRLRKVEGQLAELGSELDAAERAATDRERAASLWNADRAAQLQQAEKARKPGREPKELSLDEVVYVERSEATPPADPSTRAGEQECYAALVDAREAHTRISAVRARIERGRKTTADGVAAARKRERRAERLREQTYALDRELAVASERRRTQRRLQREIRGYTVQLSERKLVDDLAEVYSPRGAKITAIREKTEALTAHLNRYSPLLFIEPFTFSIVVEANQFDVLVTRPDGRVSDVRRLSGAEAIQFALLWMISVIREIPASRRVNVAILDEFEAGLSPAAGKLLMESYLPELSKAVEHVVFLTPNPVKPDPDGRYRVYEVEKRGSVSKIELKEA